MNPTKGGRDSIIRLLELFSGQNLDKEGLDDYLFTITFKREE
jgi:hypothetical protein